MTINSHLTEFHGKPVSDYEHGKPFNVTATAPRLSLDWDAYEKGVKWGDLLDEFLSMPDASDTTHLVVGAAEGFEGDMMSSMTLDSLIANKAKLANLEALFINDITYEECELSWINPGDFTQLWRNFPHLKALGIRGFPGKLGDISMPNLESFKIECSGISKTAAQQIQKADLPNMTRLEIWVGTDEYGGNTGPEDWAALFSGNIFPQLNYLGLQNCDYTDQIAQALADAPILDRIETLDLSLGILSDEGAVALYTSEKIRKLKHLDLHHHYMTDWMMGRFNGKDLPAPPSPASPESTPATPVAQPQKDVGFFGRLFGKTQPATPAPVPENDTQAGVDYGRIPLIPAGSFGPSVNMEDQQEDDDGYRYISTAE